ncbi:MAG TPA: radical SAM protein [Thermoanaerobaculia bacterium]|nr:radical SAM protein [Thermoanaerobaculia bacterium]
MIGQPLSLKKAYSLLRDPVTSEKRRILAERWASLEKDVKYPTQGLGQKATGCGATIGIQPRCDFACTGCYLGDEANRIPALPMSAILRQLDELRAYLGPKSNVQITDGEVTLRPVEELVEILRYARAIGIVPMLMTHGDNLRRQAGLLERLMTEGHLTEVSIHIDITQRGRDGYRSPRSELELMPLREEFAGMIREARRKTGLRLRAAQTLTITSDNLPQVAAVVSWTIANRDAFSLISFQPMAQVGRTRKNLRGVTPETLWHEVSKGTEAYGLEIKNTRPMNFGHEECTRFVPLMAIENSVGKPKLVQFIRDEPDDIALMTEFFSRGLGGVAFRDDLPLEMVARGAGMLKRQPRWLFGRARRWVNRRLKEEVGTSFFPLLLNGLRGKVRVDGITFTSHHFMEASQLDTELGQARLAACVFRIPYNGEMVPMCQMNAGGVREEFYAGIAGPERLPASAELHTN